MRHIIRKRCQGSICAMLAAQAQLQGAELLEALKMFKAYAWAAKLYCRHKETLGAQFKSIA